jgi:hypothetical protein
MSRKGGERQPKLFSIDNRLLARMRRCVHALCLGYRTRPSRVFGPVLIPPCILHAHLKRILRFVRLRLRGPLEPPCGFVV